SADVMRETLGRSSLGSLGPGSAVNLERPLRPDGRLGGHIVQGHVDGTGTIVRREPWDVIRISVPSGLARYVIEKGSIAVDGVSLTISALGPDWVQASLTPETLARTTLGRKQPGETVNLEVDMIAKYVERLMGGAVRPESPTTSPPAMGGWTGSGGAGWTPGGPSSPPAGRSSWSTTP